MGENTQAVVTKDVGALVNATIDELEQLEHRAIDLRLDAAAVEAKAFIEAEGAEGLRKSKAKLAATEPTRAAEHAEAAAAATRRKVDLLLRLVTAGGLQA